MANFDFRLVKDHPVYKEFEKRQEEEKLKEQSKPKRTFEEIKDEWRKLNEEMESYKKEEYSDMECIHKMNEYANEVLKLVKELNGGV